MYKNHSCAFAIYHKENYICGCSDDWKICKEKFTNISELNCEFFIKFQKPKKVKNIKPLKCCMQNCIFNSKIKPFVSPRSCRYRTKNKSCIITHQ